MLFYRLTVYASALCLLCSFSCDTPSLSRTETISPVSPAPPFSRNELFAALQNGSKLTFVYGANDYDKLKPYLDELDSLEFSGRTRIDKQVLADTALTKEDLTSQILFVIGKASTNALVEPITRNLPLQLGADNFVFADKSFDQQTDLIKLFSFPNPNNPSIPAFCVTGNNSLEIAKYLVENLKNYGSRYFWRSWGYEVVKNGEKIIFGYFNESTWSIGDNVHYDFSEGGDLIASTTHYNFIREDKLIEKEDLKPLFDRCEHNMKTLLKFTSGKWTAAKLTYRIFSGVEEKGLKTESNHLASLEEDHTISIVVNGNLDGSKLYLENQLILDKILPQNRFLALKSGLSLVFTEDWRGLGYQFWVNKLFSSGNLPSLIQLMDNKIFEQSSNLVFPPAAASFTQFLIGKWGQSQYLKNYADWNPSESELSDLEKEWHDFIQSQMTAVARQDAPDPPFLKGFNFAHEGYQIYNGFGSKLAAQSIGKMNQIGSNVLAIVPYSFMNDAFTPSEIPIVRESGAENDESVLYAHFAAKQIGMLTMVKPQIWVRGGWPGDIEMKTEEDWQLFFDNYYQWILHYAVLAEMYHFDFLCLGVELAKVTQSHPEEWKAIAVKIKQLFSGKLTYAANWGPEFENSKIWEPFDYIGIDCYYPLSDKDQPTRSEMVQKFEEILGKIEGVSQKYGKPVVFTEIGFRSVDTPWKNPHEDAQSRPYNETAQDLCYDIVLNCIEGKKWIQGILWWKWPSYLDYTKRDPFCFTPSGKKAELTVQNWFGQNKLR